MPHGEVISLEQAWRIQCAVLHRVARDAESRLLASPLSYQNHRPDSDSDRPRGATAGRSRSG